MDEVTIYNEFMKLSDKEGIPFFTLDLPIQFQKKQLVLLPKCHKKAAYLGKLMLKEGHYNFGDYLKNQVLCTVEKPVKKTYISN